MKKGSIKLSVMYPSGEGKHFDMDYYATDHVEMVTGLLGDAVIGATVEKGLTGVGGSRPPFEAMGNLYFESVESYERSFGAHAEEILSDIPNFTNISPLVQLSVVQI